MTCDQETVLRGAFFIACNKAISIDGWWMIKTRERLRINDEVAAWRCCHNIKVVFLRAWRAG